MARPQSVSGGRPITVSVKVSQQEAAALDAVRGGLSRGEYLRRLIPNTGQVRLRSVSPNTNTAGDALTAVIQSDHQIHPMVVTEVVESPLTEEPIVDPITDMVPTEVISHRHRRGKVIGEHFEKGQKRNSYRCAVDGCTYVMVD